MYLTRKEKQQFRIGRSILHSDLFSFFLFLLFLCSFSTSSFSLYFIVSISLPLFPSLFLHRSFPYSFSSFLLRLSHVFLRCWTVMYHYVKIEKERKLEGRENVVRFVYSNRIVVYAILK